MYATYASLVHQDLRKGKADIFAIHKLLFEKLVAPQVPGPAEEGAPQPPPPTTAVEDAGNAAAFMAWLGGDATQISAADAESYLRASAPILQGDERVELAFKVGRDSMLLTSARILLIDVMGWSGKKVSQRTRFFPFPFFFCRPAPRKAALFPFDCRRAPAAE